MRRGGKERGRLYTEEVGDFRYVIFKLYSILTIQYIHSISCLVLFLENITLSLRPGDACSLGLFYLIKL